LEARADQDGQGWVRETLSPDDDNATIMARLAADQPEHAADMLQVGMTALFEDLNLHPIVFCIIALAQGGQLEVEAAGQEAEGNVDDHQETEDDAEVRAVSLPLIHPHYDCLDPGTGFGPAWSELSRRHPKGRKWLKRGCNEKGIIYCPGLCCAGVSGGPGHKR